MKKITIVVLCSILLLSLSGTASAISTILLDEDFEDGAVGSYPDGWISSGNRNDRVVNTLSASGSNSFQLIGSPGGCWESLSHKKIALPSDAVLKISGSIYTTTSARNGCHGFNGGIGFYTGASWTLPSRSLMFFYPNGQVGGLGSYNVNAWNDFTVIYDNSGSSEVEVTYFINGEDRGTVTSPKRSYENQLNYFSLHSGEFVVYFDDILIETYDPNNAPNANANGPYSGNEGTPVTFDASGSSDPDGDSLKYRWDFNSDGIWDTVWSSNPEAAHTWNDNFSGTATVEVSDDKLTDTASSAITVSNVAPSVDAGADQEVLAGDAAAFTGSFTDPGVDTHTIEWDFGDGNTATGTLTPTNTYTDAGTYTVTLTVTDDDGGVGTDATTVTVSPIHATVDCNPSTLNLMSNGKWITCYIEIKDADIKNIDINTVELSYNGIGVSAVNDPKYGFVANESGYITDEDGDGIVERMVKFDKASVEALFSGPVDPATLMVSGKVIENTVDADFEGSDSIRVIEEGTKGGKKK